jgi:anaerobic C4-dicarboxylate transporter
MQWVWRMIVPLSRGRRPLYMWPPEIPWLLGMAALLVWLAFRNHRTLERGVMRIAGQVALIAAFGLVWLAAWLRLFTR